MPDFKINIIKPFGPSIAKVEFPKNIIENLNSYVDQIITDDDKSKELDYGKYLAGNVKQEFKLEQNILETSGFFSFLASSVKKWIEVTENKKITEFNLLNSWIVRQFENEYNPIHWHNGHISGVGYLKLPESFGETFQTTEKRNVNGNLSLIHGSKMFNSTSVLNIEPKIGDFYLFPNYLMHSVFPFYGKNERRSVSFNATIDEKIYNTYIQ